MARGSLPESFPELVSGPSQAPGARRFRERFPVLLGAAALLAASALAGCSPADDSTDGTASSAPTENCAKAALVTRTPGRLTIATDQPAYEPWFVDNKPANGKGFESAVAYAIATELGFTTGEVTWTTITFDKAIAPGVKDFDFDINQFSITEERRKAVDFSAPYYNVRQAVIALKSSKIANATSLAELASARLGAQVNTTSYQTIVNVIKPAAGPAVFNSNDDAKKALQNGQLDGLVVDLPTGFYMASAELKDAKIVGQLPLAVAQPEQFGLLLDKGSKLTGCVSRAIESLRGKGTLAQLESTWLAQAAGAPELS